MHEEIRLKPAPRTRTEPSCATTCPDAALALLARPAGGAGRWTRRGAALGRRGRGGDRRRVLREDPRRGADRPGRGLGRDLRLPAPQAVHVLLEDAGPD